MASLKRWRTGDLKAIGADGSASASADDGSAAFASDLLRDLPDAPEKVMLEEPPAKRQEIDLSFTEHSSGSVTASVVSSGASTLSDPRVSPVSVTSWTNAVNIEGSLGSGTYGDVYAVAGANCPGSTSALKLCNSRKNFYSIQDSVRECFGMAHAGLLTGIAFSGTRLAYFMPRLGKRLGNGVVPKYDLRTAASLMLPVAKSLAAMPGMHRDVKPSNILLPAAPGLPATLVDFSLATHQKQSSDFSVVTLWYRPVEVLLEEAYTSKVDVWSFGMVLLNVITGTFLLRPANEDAANLFVLELVSLLGPPERPWPALTEHIAKHAGGSMPQRGLLNLESMVADATGHSAKTPMVQAATDLLKMCLKVSPSERATWSQVLASPFWLLQPVSVPAAAAPVLVPHSETDAARFMSAATVRHVRQDEWPAKAQAEGATVARVNVMDHLLHYAKAFGLKDSTAIVAYWLMRYVPRGSETILKSSAALFIAASFNEDLRVGDRTWQWWARTWDEPESQASDMRTAVVNMMAELGGRWPCADISAMYAMASAAALPQPWMVPFVVALGHVPPPRRPGIMATSTPNAVADTVRCLEKMIADDAASIVSRH